MDTGELTLDQKTIEEIRKEVLSPTEEEIKLDKKYTEIQLLTNIVCSVLGFDEKLYNENIIFKFEKGVVWVYTDTSGVISDEYLFNITLRMEDINKPLELFVSHIHEFGVTNIAVFSCNLDGKCGIYTIDDGDEERYEAAEKWLNLLYKLYKRVKNKIFETQKK